MFPATAAARPPVLGGQKRCTAKVWKDGGEKKCQRGGEEAHMSKQLKDARRGRESSRLMFAEQMEGMCVSEGGRVDGE